MAEVLGTVVGVISLGIQVGSAIGTYMEGIQCRKEEVESVIRYQRAFQVLLTQIGTLKGNLLKSSISDATSLEEALKAAGAQMSQLNTFLDKILVQNPSSSLKSAGQKFRDGKKVEGFVWLILASSCRIPNRPLVRVRIALRYIWLCMG